MYGFLLEAPPTPLRTLLPDLGIFVTSLSKAVAPGLRVGWLAAPAMLVPQLAAAIRASVLMASSIAAELATQAIASGAAERAARAQRDEARARQRLAAIRLSGLDFRSHPSAFHGWLAVPAPWRRDDFTAALHARGVLVTRGSAFAGSTAAREAETHVRLCLCAIPDRARLATALDIIASVAEEDASYRLPVV
ncbi:MAG: aminotransferase class I/II-fold pyridoxal phosphate-dependent enzyme [Bacteroidales bacterium]|nr:aminotransferase class I/II-fold pyridoxal phosphate-dependent enzyme [Bacteroidales bacterium]